MAEVFFSLRRPLGNREDPHAESLRERRLWLQGLLEPSLGPRRAGRSHWTEEARSLLHETDPELFDEGLLQLAGRIELSTDADALGIAQQIYHRLGGGDNPVASRARARGLSLAGGGSGSQRWEGALRSFARQATDPAMLAALGLASGVASLTRVSLLSRFLSGGRSAILGIPAPFVAGTGALLVEAPTWVFAEQGLRRLLGSARPGEHSLGEQVLSATLSLGAMRLAGFLPMNRTAAQVSGIFLANRLEQAMGLRPSVDGAASVADSLLLFAQMRIAGHLSRALLGRHWSAAQNGLDTRARILAAASPRRSFSLFPLEPVPASLSPATTGIVPFLRPPPRPELTNVVFNQSLPEGGGSNRRSLLGRRLHQLAQPTFGGAKLPSQTAKPSSRRIGVLTSGGDGPGENAAIAALVRGASEIYGWEVFGIWDGYRGLLQSEGRIQRLTLRNIEGKVAVEAALRQIYGRRWEPELLRRHPDIATLGGNILRSSRVNPVAGDPGAQAVKATLKAHGIEGLIVLGGNGSQRAAAALHRAGVPVVFLPQSIDADVPGSELSIGFPSAVAKGVSELQLFYHTGQSCDRWFFVEVMGQNYGALSLSVAREGRADGIFTEIPRPLTDIADLIRRRARYGQNHGVAIIAESVVFSGEHGAHIHPPRGRDQHGRLLVESGDIAKWVSQQVGELGIPHTRSAPLGYLLRGAWPTSSEIALAETLSWGALHLVAQGAWGKMAGLRFQPRSSEFQMIYPDLSTVARQTRRLSPRWEKFVREELER